MNIPEANETELHLIGAMLLPGLETASLIAGQLQEEDFLDPRCLHVHKAIQAVLKDRIPLSAFTVRDALQKAGRLDQVGGVQWLLDLASTTVDLSDYQPLVETLHSKRRLRDLARVGKALVVNSTDGMHDPLELATETQAELKRISMGAGKLEVGTGMDILHEMAFLEPLGGAGDVVGGYWGDRCLDEWCPIPRGEFATFGGRPGLGKSTMMAQGMFATAKRGKKVLGLTMEMNQRKLKARVGAHVIGIPFGRLLRGQYDASHVALLGQHEDTLRRIYYADPQNGTPWSKLEALIRYQVEYCGIETVFLDQFDKIGRGDIKSGSTEAYSFGRISEQIMAMTKDLDIGFVLLCQLKNENETEPTLGSHADSDRPGKDANVVVHLYRSGQKIKGKIQKNRDGGYVGHVFDVNVDGGCQRINVVESETDSKRKKL